MSSLELLKSLCLPRPFKSFKDLEPKEYRVHYFSLVPSNLGQRVRIDLADCYLFLPERFAKIMKEPVLNDLNNRAIIMVYDGKDKSNMNRLLLDFKDVETNGENFDAQSMANLDFNDMQFYTNFQAN